MKTLNVNTLTSLNTGVNTMNTLTTNTNKETMSHVEIATLTNKRNDNVKRTMEALKNQGVISVTQIEEPQLKGGKPTTYYYVNERDSYIVVAQLSPKYTAFLVDAWRSLKQANQVATFNIPTTLSGALQLASELAGDVDTLNKTIQVKAIGSTRVGRLATKFVEAYPQADWISACTMNQILIEAGLQIQVEGGYSITEAGREFGTNVSQYTNQPVVYWSTFVFECKAFQTICDEFHKRFSRSIF